MILAVCLGILVSYRWGLGPFSIFIDTWLLGHFAPIFYLNCEHVLFVYICGHVMSHKKFGPDRFSRFDAYWIQTDRQKTNRQAKFIYRLKNQLLNCSGKESNNIIRD